jgi:ABC-type uncharacterized transport system ATPase component
MLDNPTTTPADARLQPALSNSLTDLAARIRAEHEATIIALGHSIQHAMAAGDLLIEAKAQLKHGQWLPWLKEHCAVSDRTARLYMRLARRRSRRCSSALLPSQPALCQTG